MATLFTLRLFLLIAAADQAQANQIAQDVGLGPDTWRRPVIRVIDADTAAARGYVCDIQMRPARAQQLRDALIAAGIEARGARQQRSDVDPLTGTPTLAEFLAARATPLRVKPYPRP